MVAVVRALGGPAAGRRAGVVAALVVVLATSACGGGTPDAADGASDTGSTVPVPSIAPFVGGFSTVVLPAGVQALRDVDCPSVLRCWAVGSSSAAASAAVVTTTDGGATWKVQPVPSSVGYLAAIACPTTRACTAVGQFGADGAGGTGAVLATTDAGAAWTPAAVPAGTSDVTAVDCPVAGTCLALADVDGRVTTLTAGAPGAPWTAGGALPPTVSAATALSCTGPDDCWAAATSPVDVAHAVGAVAVTTDAGATWALQTLPPGTGVLSDIACTATAVAGGAGAPGGRAGVGATTIPPTTTATAGTTATGTATTAPPTGPSGDCTAVGSTSTVTGATRTGQGLILTTGDGGSTWSPSALTAAYATSADLLAVSCGAGPCVAVGTTVASAPEPGIVVLAGVTGSGSDAWRRATVADLPLALSGVSCRSLASCVVVGESGAAHLSAT